MSEKNKLYNREKILLLFACLFFVMITPDKLNSFPAVHLNISRQFVLMISIFIVMVLLFKGHIIKVTDKYITISLISRSLYFFICSLLFIENLSHFFSYYLLILIFPIIFIAIQNSDINGDNIIVLILKCSVIIVGIQTASAFLTLVIHGHGLFQIKALIAIPIGNSNTIASIVLLQAVLCYFLIKNKVYFVISTISLLFTISKWGFLSFAIVITISLVINSNKKNKIRNIFTYTLIILLVYFIAEKYLPSYFSVYNSTLESVFNNDYSTLYNGRDTIFRFYGDLISKKCIFGYGLGVETPYVGMAHNFIIQSLYFGGVIGLILYYLPYFFMIFRIRNLKKCKERNALIIFVFALFVNGFAENVFFTAPSEYISAVYLGLLYKFLVSEEGNQYDQ